MRPIRYSSFSLLHSLRPAIASSPSLFYHPSPKSNSSQTNNTMSLHFQNMDELKKVFDQFDTNRDGKISVAELGGVLKAMGSTYTVAEIERVMDDVDTDKDGFINLDEFAQLCHSSSSGSAEAELKEAFDLYDQNKNGLISCNELHQVLTRLGMPCSLDDCARMIKTVDSDGDGCVNFEEFQKMMATSAAKGGN